MAVVHEPDFRPLPPGGPGGFTPPGGPERVGPPALAVAAVLFVVVSVLLGAVAMGQWWLRGVTAYSPVVPGVPAAAVEAVVDITSTVQGQSGFTAGTGIVLTASGIVLTNNHVIEGAVSTTVTDVGNGRTYPATVVGYDVARDVAVLQLSGASGLVTSDLGDSDGAAVGQPVSAVGNADGVGGTPSQTSGVITALDASITALDDVTGTSEDLSGLIQTDVPIVEGYSGGPLVDLAGKVIGLDTAASSGYRFRFRNGAAASFAVPINEAVTVVDQIRSGRSSPTVHVGPTAFLGVQIAPPGSFDGQGAAIAGVVPGSPAAGTGLAAGDVLVSLGGTAVDSPSTLTSLIEGYRPGTRVGVGWTDRAGARHSATVTLVAGPAG